MERADGILIVEDRSIVAAKIKRELEAAGFSVAAMASSEPAALKLARALPLRAAVLDIDLRGVPVYAVAEALHARRIPFLFLTGYSQTAVPRPWQHVHLVEKPFEAETLLQALGLAMTGHRAPAGADRAVTPAIRRAWDRVRHTRDILTEQRAWVEQFDQNRH